MTSSIIFITLLSWLGNTLKRDKITTQYEKLLYINFSSQCAIQSLDWFNTYSTHLIYSTYYLQYTVKPRFNKVLDITKWIFQPRLSYNKGKNLHLMNPRYNKRIFSVPWQFVTTRFHCTSSTSNPVSTVDTVPQKKIILISIYFVPQSPEIIFFRHPR